MSTHLGDLDHRIPSDAGEDPVAPPAPPSASPPVQAQQDGSQIRPFDIVGDDDRFPIADTRTPPWRRVCHLVVSYDTGGERQGTGWILGHRTAVTAAHNLYRYLGGGQVARATNVSITPARYGAGEPYGRATSSDWSIAPGWDSSPDFGNDIGVIRLADNAITRKPGSFALWAPPDAALPRGLALHTAGYPDKDGSARFMYGASDVLSSAQDTTLIYLNDTTRGQSGSPIFIEEVEGQKTTYTVIGVHSAYLTGANIGARITAELFDFLRNAMA